MKLVKIAFLLIVILFSSCASGYKSINPGILTYHSKSTNNDVALEYKYELLEKKYRKKELKNGVKLVAVKITNNSNRDLIFGKDIKLSYDDNSVPNVMETEKIYKSLKQSVASYLFYMLLTPLQFTTTKTTNGFVTESSSTPIGLVIGPLVTGINVVASSSANTKFKGDLSTYNLEGVTIKAGESKSGLIGLRSKEYNAIKVTVE